MIQTFNLQTFPTPTLFSGARSYNYIPVAPRVPTNGGLTADSTLVTADNTTHTADEN